jgi:hypothetical protein
MVWANISKPNTLRWAGSDGGIESRNPPLTAPVIPQGLMNTRFVAFDAAHPLGERATHPLACHVAPPCRHPPAASARETDPGEAGILSLLRTGHPAQTQQQGRLTEESRELLINSSFPRRRESSALIHLGSRLRGNDKID